MKTIDTVPVAMGVVILKFMLFNFNLLYLHFEPKLFVPTAMSSFWPEFLPERLIISKLVHRSIVCIIISSF